jgi:hypothetical protein
LEIIKFSEDSLATALTNEYTSKEIIKSKNQFNYFKDYLGPNGIDAKTIFIEKDYISKDFLLGFASYYTYCFENYPKVCKRVHFFRNEFDEDYFSNQILKDQRDEDFWNNYLGFIVVKPIPITVIGFTVLKTYHNNRLRNFWGIREYDIHIFGTEIKIESLAFQEQDSVIAACATTAIWSMLNKASLDYHTTLKTPSEITKDADNVSPDGSRLFPNKGLSILQICQSIVNSGLVSEVKRGDYFVNDDIGNVISAEYLKKILNAYSPIGIPLILVVKVPNGNEYGWHALTVSGYKQNAPELKNPTNAISWYSDGIVRIYAHDDQWGPFARSTFISEYEIETHWTKIDPQKRGTLVQNIVVPVYPKIRISYENIEALVLGIDIMLTIFFDSKILADLVWDIKIDYSEVFKNRLKKSTLNNDTKLKKISKGLPKYIWVTKCFIADQTIIEFIFDATGVSNAMLCKDVICYLPKTEKNILKDFLNNNKEKFKRLINHSDNSNYFEFIVETL